MMAALHPAVNHCAWFGLRPPVQLAFSIWALAFLPGGWSDLVGFGWIWLDSTVLGSATVPVAVLGVPRKTSLRAFRMWGGWIWSDSLGLSLTFPVWCPRFSVSGDQAHLEGWTPSAAAPWAGLPPPGKFLPTLLTSCRTSDTWKTYALLCASQ